MWLHLQVQARSLSQQSCYILSDKPDMSLQELGVFALPVLTVKAYLHTGSHHCNSYSCCRYSQDQELCCCSICVQCCPEDHREHRPPVCSLFCLAADGVQRHCQTKLVHKGLYGSFYGILAKTLAQNCGLVAKTIAPVLQALQSC